MPRASCVYTWDALDHIPLTDSKTQPPPNGFPWDAYHVNSIDSAGRLCVPGVHAQYVGGLHGRRPRPGAIEWQLGGKHSTFQVPADASFEWQHDVQVHPGSIVTMFDDDCCQITGAGTYLAPAGPSRALELKLNTTAQTGNRGQ